LSLLCHHVSFIEDDELEAFRKQCPGLRKLLDLFAHYIYTSVVRCIELNKISIAVYESRGDLPPIFVSYILPHKFVLPLQELWMSSQFQVDRRIEGEASGFSQ
jgi:hypothetical protein